MTEAERDAIRNARNAYRREWNKRNREKNRAAQERYWLKQAMKSERGGENGKATNT